MFDLWKHQRAALAFARSRRGTMLAIAMGAGKTRVALALAQEWRCQRILITSPISVVRSWIREMVELQADLPWVLVQLDRKGVALKADFAERALRRAELLGKPCAIVVNHESLWRGAFGAFVLRTPWDLVIVDESHRAKSPSGRFSVFLRHLGTRIPRKLCLTGTPAPHSPLDLFAQYRFLDPTIYGGSYHAFKRRYAVLGGYQNHQVVGFQNTRELWEKFRLLAYQISKEEALTLPPEIDLTRECALEPKAQAAYDAMSKVFWAEVEHGEVTASNALVKLLRLQQITSGRLATDEGEESTVSTAKAELLDDVLEDCTPPVVVFCRFVRDLDLVEEAAKVCDWTYGEISGRRKDGLDDDARLAKGVQLCGVQIQSGGVGIDLSRSSTAIYYSVGYSLGDMLQARSRLHRPGQQHPVRHVHLVVSGTIDEKIFAALKRREEVIDTILKRGPHE